MVSGQATNNVKWRWALMASKVAVSVVIMLYVLMIATGVLAALGSFTSWFAVGGTSSWFILSGGSAIRTLGQPRSWDEGTQTGYYLMANLLSLAVAAGLVIGVLRLIGNWRAMMLLILIGIITVVVINLLLRAF